MKIIACIPVYGRRELVKLTIERLYKVNKVFKVICSGDNPLDKEVCEKAGAEWVTVPNSPLGRKWNAAIKEAEKYRPDAVLFVGSSDWLSENWLPEATKYISEADIIGKTDCYFSQIYANGEIKSIYWGGYIQESGRLGEPIGIGRLFSQRCLDRLDWKPIDPFIENGIDYSTLHNILKVGGVVKNIENDEMISLSIGTYQWENKHKFESESSYPTSKILNESDNEKIKSLFPELTQIFGGKTDTLMEFDYKGLKVVPYTYNVGNYDAPRNDIRCFTDYQNFKSDPRNSRIYLALPHKFMDCDISILVGCEVTVKVPYEVLIKEWLGDADMALFRHPWRDCVHEEIIAAGASRMKGNVLEAEILKKQGEHYRKIDIPDHVGKLPETAIIIRRHTKKVQRFNEAWWAEMCRWSYRDQCSYPVVIRDFPELKVNYIEPDVRVHPYTEIGNHLK
jgi:hypothetical protein